MSEQPIEVGQRWRSRDRHDNGRTVTVEEVDNVPWTGFVVVRSVRKSQLRKRTLRARYTLVSPTPPAADRTDQ